MDTPQSDSSQQGNLVSQASTSDHLPQVLPQLSDLTYPLQKAQTMDLSKLSAPEMERVNQIVSTVSFTDTNSLMTFGADAQRQLSSHLDALLEGLRTSETGRAGEITIELATTIKSLRLQEMKREVEKNGGAMARLGKLPVLGSLFSALRYLQLNHKKISDHLTAIEAKAQGQLTGLKAINDKLDKLVDASIDHMRQMELYMAAGQIVALRARADFAKRLAVVQQSKDLTEVSRLRDYAEQINAFETRVVRMHLAHGQSMVSVPEIRATQTAAQIEANNVMDSIMFDIPNLKRAIIKIASLAATAQVAKETDARRTLNRELSGIGSTELQNAYLKAKNSQGNFEADVTALQEAATKLLETIDMGRRIDTENVGRRSKAIADLSSIKQNFTAGLLQAGNQFVQSAQR